MKKVYIVWDYNQIVKICDSSETATKIKENCELLDKGGEIYIEENDVLSLNEVDHYSNYLNNDNENNLFEMFGDYNLFKVNKIERLGLHLMCDDYNSFTYKIVFKTNETNIKKIHKIGEDLLNEVELYLHENGVDLDDITRYNYPHFKSQVEILMKKFKGSFDERSVK